MRNYERRFMNRADVALLFDCVATLPIERKDTAVSKEPVAAS